MEQGAGVSDGYGARVRRGGVLPSDDLEPTGRYRVVCRDRHGRVKWEDQIENLVVTEGRNALLTAGLAGGTQIATWYLGLKEAGAVAAGDTMAAHAGWVENVDYDGATRPAWVPGVVANGSVSNAESRAVFVISEPGSIAGCFLVSDSEKGGTNGTLYSAGDFTNGAKAVDSGDTLEVAATYALTAAA